MNNLAQFVMENTLSGKIEKNTGIEILKQIMTNKSANQKDIAIIGMSGRFPYSDNLDEFWNNIKNGVDCIGDFPEFRKWDCDELRAYTYLGDRNGEYCQGGYLREIDKFDYSFFKLSPKEASLMDPSQKLFMETVVQTLEDGGYGGKKVSGTRVGIYVGYNTWPIYGQIVSSINPEAAADSIVGNLPSMIPSRISFFLDLKGPALMIDTACSSSLISIHLACQALKNGDCEMAVAGGVNIRMFPLKGEGDLGTDASDFRTKTFDESSDGTAWGEGVAALLLKPLDKAKQDGDNIYAIIKGSAANQDGNSIGITAPNVEAQEDMLVMAWENAGINPESISYIEAHGTGTKLGDPIEVDAIKRAFERFTNKKQFCAIGSVKTNIGHLDSVSGVSGLIKTVLSLKNRIIPPSLNFNLPNYKIDFVKSPVYVNTEPVGWETDESPRRCGINSFGLSGTNCHVVLEEYVNNTAYAQGNESEGNILAISAKSEYSIKELINNYKKLAGKNTEYSLRDVCYTANTGRGHYNYRLAVVLNSWEDFSNKFSSIDVDKLDKCNGNGVYYSYHKVVSQDLTNKEAWQITDDKMFELNEKAQKSVLVYTEQREQIPGLLDEICKLYVKGASIEWTKLYSKGRTISLPTYPFDRKRCWVETQIKDKRSWQKNRYFEIGWNEEDLPVEDTCMNNTSTTVIIYEKGFGKEVASILKAEDRNVIEVIIGKQFEIINDKKYIVDGSINDYEKFFNTIKGIEISQIVHMVTAKNKIVILTADDLEEALNMGVYNLFNLLKAIYSSNITHIIQLVIVSSYIQRVTGNEEVRPENSTLSGLGKVVGLESIYLKCRCIDIDESVSAREIADEMNSRYDKYMIAYRDGKRYVEEIRKLDIARYSLTSQPLKQNGVYVITGGMGGIGLEISKYLSAICPINIVFFNRSHFPAREKWAEILESHSDTSLYHRIKVIKDIEKGGSSVTCFSVDVSNQEQVERALDNLRSRYGNINGIIHGAGVAGNGLIINKDSKVFRDVLLPKVYGTWILDNATRNDKLDFFLMFSSGTSMFGDMGQGDYMAANAYLDSYEAYRNQLGRKTVTVNWTGWKEVGMAKDNNANIDATFKAMLTSNAVKAFNGIFSRNVQRVLIGELNLGGENLGDLSGLNIPFNLSDEIISDIENFNNGKSTYTPCEQRASVKEVKLEGRKSGSYTAVETEVARVWGEFLGFDAISIYDNFFEIGGDSIKAVQILIHLKKYKLDMKDLFQYPTIIALSEYISCSTHNNQLSSEDESECCNKRTYDESCLGSFAELKIIENIKPFNDIYFKDCFYNAFFSVVRYFNKDVTAFLVNEVTSYNYDRTKQGIRLGIQYNTAANIESIMKESGISTKTETTCNNVIYRILEGISNNNPVIIRVDSFYESIRIDTFNQVHWSHSLLVYGYDKQKRVFYVLEQENMNSLTYKEKCIDFEDINNAYMGFLENFYDKEKLPTYYEFISNTSSICTDSIDEKAVYYADMYIRNINNFKENIIQGLKYLEAFRDDFAKILSNQHELNRNIDEMLYIFNEIVKAKYAERYKNNRFEGGMKHEILVFLDEIIEGYSYIKSVLAKYRYTKRYNERLINSVIGKFEQIVKAEWDYHEALFNIKL